jgi:hypothetical protein
MLWTLIKSLINTKHIKKGYSMKNAKRKMNQVNKIVAAWESLAPDASFGGMTLEQFKAAVKPAFDSSDRVGALDSEALGEKKRWVDNTQSSHVVAKRAVNGMLSDPNYGADSPLYAAMGYTRTSDRKSGLTRRGQAANAAVAAVAQKA